MKDPALLSLATMIALSSCTGTGNRGDDGQLETTVVRSIEEVQEAFTREWMDLPGVVGTGIGLCEGQPCIKVFVAGPIQRLEERIPDEVDGHRVILEQTGRFEPRDTASNSCGSATFVRSPVTTT